MLLLMSGVLNMTLLVLQLCGIKLFVGFELLYRKLNEMQIYAHLTCKYFDTVETGDED